MNQTSYLNANDFFQVFNNRSPLSFPVLDNSLARKALHLPPRSPQVALTTPKIVRSISLQLLQPKLAFLPEGRRGGPRFLD